MAKRRNMAKRHTKAVIAKSDIVPVAGDAGIAGPSAEGLMVPLVILDTSERPDIDEIIRVHSHISPGDIESTWTSIAGYPDDVVLVLDFIRPIAARVAIRFSIEKQAIIIDMALRAKALYIQAGRHGDRLIHDPDRPKIIVELQEGEFNKEWEAIFLHQMTNYFSRKQRLSKREAYPLACLMLEELRKLTSFRMPH
jgi:hypothetical protein